MVRIIEALLKLPSKEKHSLLLALSYCYCDHRPRAQTQLEQAPAAKQEKDLECQRTDRPPTSPPFCVTSLPDLKAQILSLTRDYARQAHASHRPADDPARIPWAEGSPIPYAGRVFTEDEVEAAVSATLDFWLTLGPEGEAFQKELAAFMGVRACLAVNSGSSANLLALSALTSPLLPSERRLRPGDEVITCAAGFPTTVTPILQNGCIPVFLDNDPVTGNLRVDQLEQAYVPGRTKAVMAVTI